MGAQCRVCPRFHSTTQIHSHTHTHPCQKRQQGYQFVAKPITQDGGLGLARRVAAQEPRELTVPVSPQLRTAARSHVRPPPSQQQSHV